MKNLKALTSNRRKSKKIRELKIKSIKQKSFLVLLKRGRAR